MPADQVCDDAAVHPQRPELSSVASQIDELTRRVAAAAGTAAAAGDEAVTADLYEVERALRSAERRLQALVRRLA
jgi:hypothetical protein